MLSMTTTVTQMKCACPSCLCVVSVTDAVIKDGKAYCGEECANNHPNGQGCGHTGCDCQSNSQLPIHNSQLQSVVA